MLSQKFLNNGRALLKWFKINNKPANEVMSDGEVEIFLAVAFKLYPRIACLAPTGYGKSEAISIGTTFRTHFYHEDFIIASVKYGTSDIIMDKTIEHIFDDSRFIDELGIDSEEKLSRLKSERKKTHLTFKKGGSIKIVSLYGADLDVSKAIGEHAANIILDESPLLTPSKYLQVLKILEGTGSYDDTFLFELGNAVNRNHFMHNVKFNPNYYKISISLDQAIKEGRLDPKSVEEKRNMPFFEQFYECKFPEENAIDDKGYRVLLTEEEVNNAFVDSIENEQPEALGVDVGAGGDYNAYILRSKKTAWIHGANKSNDTMTNVTEIENVLTEKNLKGHDVFLDDIGIGRGVSDRLKEKQHSVNSVSAGAKSSDPTRFANIKAEAYWSLRVWIKNGGKLLRDNRFMQLAWIKYKISSDKVLQIEPKDDLKQRTGKSPDFAEALMLTFAPKPPQFNIRWL